MNTLSTHVLDATAGTPASEVEVTLTDSAGTVLGTGVTDDDGRITSMTESPLPTNVRPHLRDRRLVRRPRRRELLSGSDHHFPYPGRQSHFHVPLLLSPFSYSTYRGS